MLETLLAVIQNTRGWNAAALGLFALVVHIAASNFAWRSALAPGSDTARELARAAAQPPIRAGFQIARLVYYIGLPFVGLYLGWLDLRSVGLGLLDWAEGIRWAIVILLAAWLALMLIWLPYLRTTADVSAPPMQPPLARRLVELVYMQGHWTLYRAAGIVMLTGIIPDALYWGAMIGLALTGVETLADPRVRAALTRIGQADGVVWSVGQAVINTLAFLVTRNLYLLVLIQFALELTIPHIRPSRAPERANLTASILRRPPGQAKQLQK